MQLRCRQCRRNAYNPKIVELIVFHTSELKGRDEGIFSRAMAEAGCGARGAGGTRKRRAGGRAEGVDRERGAASIRPYPRATGKCTPRPATTPSVPCSTVYGAYCYYESQHSSLFTITT